MAAKKKKEVKRANNTKKNVSADVTGGTPPPMPFSPPPAVNDEVNSKIAALDAIASKFNSQDHLVMVRGDEAPNPYTLRRPTGITELDIHLGGGFPAGGMCFISGVDNSGKSWLMMQTLAMQQKIYGDKAILAMGISEGGFPYDQAMRVGLRVGVPDDMIQQWQAARVQRGMDSYTSEDIAYFKTKIGDFRILRGSTGEELLSIVLQVVASKACSIVCVDSLQGLQPACDADKDMDDAEKRAAHATMIGRFLKKYVPLTTGLNGSNETTLIMTQQVRSNPNKASAPSHIQQYLPDWAITGAYTARHYKLVDLVLSEGALKKEDMPGRGKQVVGKTLKWFTEKGKAGTHDNLHGEVLYSYKIQQGVDFVGTVIDSGMQRGVIRKTGNKVQLIRPDTGEVLPDVFAPNLSNLKKILELDFESELAARYEIMAAAGIQCLYR